MYNLLPLSLRNVNSNNVDTFKTNLVAFFNDVPYQPTVSGKLRAAETNSLLHQIPMMKAAIV